MADLVKGLPVRGDSAVGMIGLGIMGSAMAANLMKAGYAVIGYDVLVRRRREHRAAGGQAVSRCRDLRHRVPVIICSLPSASALLDTAAELSSRSGAPQVVIETSTLPIDVKDEARRLLARRRIVLLDCPLSGTGAQARKKDIIVYASGDRAACRRVTPMFDAFARGHYYVGPFGAGSKMKFVANLLVAIHNVAAAEALTLARRAGLDPAMTYKAIADGGGTSRMFEVRGPLMVARDYSHPTMKLNVWQKDMRAIAEFAARLQCPTPLFAATGPLYTAAMALGRQEDDTAAVHAVLEEMASTGGRRPRHGAAAPRVSKRRRRIQRGRTV